MEKNWEYETAFLNSSNGRREESLDQLRVEIHKGIDSPGIPADEAAERLRRFAQGLT